MSPFDYALSEPEEWTYRGQSPQPYVAPPQGGTTYYQPTSPYFPNQPGTPTYGGTPTDPFANPGNPAMPAPGYPAPGYQQPMMQDPWSSNAPMGPYITPQEPMMYMYGMNGSQPMRFGWQDRIDAFFIPKAGTNGPNVGQFGITGVDIEKEYTTPLGMSGWVGRIAPQFGYRSWNGPKDPTPTTDLPANGYRLGLGMALQSPNFNGITYEIAFNPSVGTDFDSSLTSDAYMFDAQAAGYWRINPEWLLAFGAFYWDRVDSIILPYGGVVWTPNDIWELRILFPSSRISVFVGAPWNIPTWMYAAIEYHVEAYQVRPEMLGEQTRVQMSDIRLTGGFRWETGSVTSFLEAGYVFGREVRYKKPGTGFDVDDAFIARIGLQY